MESDAVSGMSEAEQLPRRSPAWRRVLWWVSLGCVCLAMLYMKVASNARASFRLGEEAYAAGEFKSAIASYERAIKWYTPWSAVIAQSIERLWHIGAEAETRQDLSLALQAYQTLRSSLYAVQSVYIPYQSWITESEARIAPLLARLKAGPGEDPERLTRDTARYAQQFQRPVGPHLGWAVLVACSFLSWVGTTIGLIWHVVDSEGRFVPRQGLCWGSFLVLSFALWLLSMRLA
ncbi:MAG: tol-pal system YbgF family protein [Candidatus Tectimicrobiota bacterium]